jgi:hypothetical protein
MCLNKTPAYKIKKRKTSPKTLLAPKPNWRISLSNNKKKVKWEGKIEKLIFALGS